MANLWQELQDGSGEQRANGKSDEKGERVFHIARLHQGHDEDSGEGEQIDDCDAQERKTPHQRFEWQEGWMEEEDVTLKHAHVIFLPKIQKYANCEKGSFKGQKPEMGTTALTNTN